jgi:predicted RNase H-like HicB family nuclease
MNKKAKRPYQITVAWSPEDDCYVARVPAIRHCLACGDTAAQALKEVHIATEVMLETLAAQGKPIPAADVQLARLAALAPLLNLSAIARGASMPVQTLATKLQRGTAFTAEDGAKIGNVLAAHGLAG